MKAKLPDSYVLLFLIILIIGVTSYFIPSGSFERQTDPDTGITQVVPDSYQVIEKERISFFDIFKAIPKGMIESSNIIIFVLLTGGSFGIIQATGTINSIISNLSNSYIGKEKIAIPLVMFLFSLTGAIFGTAEEALPLYPLIISLAIGLGFDNLTGVAMILLGTGSGFVAGFLNPFTTGIAQQISGLPLFSGMIYRVIAFIIFVSTGILYVYHYAVKTKKETNRISENDSNNSTNSIDTLNFSSKHLRVTIVLLLFLIFLLIGVIKWKFYILEISTTFLMMGIISGLLGGLNSGRITTEFVKGASNLVYGALIIGLAKGVMSIMSMSKIMDTVIYQLSLIVKYLPSSISAITMFLTQSIINLFITSGSGQAAVTMPIMKTLADISNITRQTAVLAFQFGDGFSNIISPTSGYFMAALSIGGITWKKWAKWVWPLVIIWYIQGIILIAIASYIGYGPF